MKMIEIAEPLIMERFFVVDGMEERMYRMRWSGVRARRVDWAAMWHEVRGGWLCVRWCKWSG